MLVISIAWLAGFAPPKKFDCWPCPLGVVVAGHNTRLRGRLGKSALPTRAGTGKHATTYQSRQKSGLAWAMGTLYPVPPVPFATPSRAGCARHRHQTFQPVALETLIIRPRFV